MRRVAALAALLVLVGSSPALSASPTITLESQAWWDKTGIVVPGKVGAHIHVKATVPLGVVDGTIDIPVTITLHEARGSLSWFRIGTESKTLHQRGVALGPCADCTVSFTVRLDLSGVPTGRHELRMSANNPDEDPDLAGSQRMFQSTGWQVCVRSCTPTYRSGFHTEARGWYTDRGYANARLSSDPTAVRSGGTIRVKLAPGSGGLPTKFAGVYIDPDFHHGSAGITVKTWWGPFTGTVTLPTLAPGAHRLVLLSSDGLNAGVLVVPFTVPE